MDRKTLFSSLFAATVVAGAAVKTAVDPDLRGLFVRMVSPPIPPPPPPIADRPLPIAWPRSLELMVDPSLVAPMHSWGTGESFQSADEPWAGDTEMVALTAIERTADAVTLWFNIGNICLGQTFKIRIEQSRSRAPNVFADADWWTDFGRPIMVHADGSQEQMEIHRAVLGQVVGSVTIDSLDWTPGHDIAVKLALGCAFDDSPEHWLWIEGGGTTTIQPPN